MLNPISITGEGNEAMVNSVQNLHLETNHSFHMGKRGY